MNVTVSTSAPSFSIIDKTMFENVSESYHLSIKIDVKGISFSIFSYHNKRIIALEEYVYTSSNKLLYEQEIKQIIQQATILKNNFKTVTAVYVDNRSTIIPNILFDINRMEDYYVFNVNNEKREEITCDELSTLNGKNVYSIPSYLHSLLQSFFPTIQIRHYSTLLIEGLHLQHINKLAKGLYIHVYHEHFEILLLQDKKLLYYNSFFYQTNEDIVYYILYVCEQLELLPTEIELYLLGEVRKKDEVYVLLNKYIRNIDFLPLSSIQLSQQMEQLDKHYYFLLFNQHLCV